MDFHAIQPDVMSTELAEDVMEASFARGLAAAECFEVSLFIGTSLGVSRTHRQYFQAA